MIHPNSLRDDVRGTSEVVGMALLVGIVVVGIATILLVGGAQLGDVQDSTEVAQAEQSLTQFDAASARVAADTTDAQQLDLGLRANSGTLDVEPESGNVTIEYLDQFDNGHRTEVANTSLGTVVYENGDTTVGYQGGGVWRSDRDGSTLVSPPEITFQDETLTIPVIRTERGGSVHSDVQISRSTPTQKQYPNATANLTNKVDGAIVQITIESRYYEAWGQFFEAEANTIVQYDHDEQTAVIQFLALPVDYAPEAGVVATSGPGEIRLEGDGAYVDSYNSSNGTYEATRDDEGAVRSAGEVSMYGSSQIDGDVHADKDIRVESGSATIQGDAETRLEVYEHDEDSVQGEVRNDTSGVPSISPIDGLVERRVDDLSEDNDNQNASDVISDDELTFEESNELGPGKYYLKNVELQDETLVLNATGGNITIGVEQWVKLLGSQGQQEPGNVEIRGDGEVRIFVKSEEKTTVNVPGEGQEDLHFYVEENATITTVDEAGEDRHRSPQSLVFGPSRFQGAIAGDASDSPAVTAVVIAPAGPAGGGEFYVKQGELFGAVMTGNLTLGQNGEIHFDHAIRGEKIPLSPTQPRLEYLYVTEHALQVESA